MSSKTPYQILLKVLPHSPTSSAKQAPQYSTPSLTNIPSLYILIPPSLLQSNTTKSHNHVLSFPARPLPRIRRRYSEQSEGIQRFSLAYSSCFPSHLRKVTSTYHFQLQKTTLLFILANSPILSIWMSMLGVSSPYFLLLALIPRSAQALPRLTSTQTPFVNPSADIEVTKQFLEELNIPCGVVQVLVV